MAERAAGWRQGPDGEWYPPINQGQAPGSSGVARLSEMASLVNSGAVTREIDEVVDDPELAV